MNPRIKLLRHQLGLSLQALADATGLTRSYLSKLERGVCVPSIAAARKMAAALQVEVDELFSAASATERVGIVRSHERLAINREGAAEGSHLEAIAAAAGQKRMQPFVLAPAREFAAGPLVPGATGEAFLFVLKGRIEIAFPDRTEVLRVGDSACFEGDIPLRLRAAGRTPASVLVVASGED